MAAADPNTSGAPALVEPPEYGRKLVRVPSEALRTSNAREPEFPRSEPSAQIDDLYTDPTRTSKFGRALTILDEGTRSLAAALAAAERGEHVRADEEVMSFEVTLPELVSCRTLAPGLESRIAALVACFVTKRGALFQLDQLGALRAFVLRMRSEPALDVEAAFDEIMKLDDVGLTVVLPSLGAIADLAPSDDDDADSGHG